jgi:multiple sugar transport system ATP-binding protein
VAIGRALVRKPEVFLFDEPLSNLDAKLRVQMRLELARLHASLGATMIYVTHDQTEAMTLADRIVVLDKGYIAQVGSPLELYNMPANKFVAAFIGSPGMNFFGVKLDGVEGGTARVTLPGGGSALARVRSGRAEGEVELGIRPEHLTIMSAGDGSAVLKGKVAIVEHLGNATLAHVDTPAGQLVIEGEGNLAISAGAEVGLALNEAETHLFGADGAAL